MMGGVMSCWVLWGIPGLTNSFSWYVSRMFVRIKSEYMYNGVEWSYESHDLLTTVRYPCSGHRLFLITAQSNHVRTSLHLMPVWRSYSEVYSRNGANGLTLNHQERLSSSLLLMPIWKKLLRSSLSKRCKSFYSEQQRTTLTNPKQTLSLVYFWCLLKKLLRELPSKQRSPFIYERQRTTLTNPKLT